MTYKPFCSTEIVFSNKEKMKERLLSIESVRLVLVMSGSSATRWEMLPFIRTMEGRCQSKNGSFVWINAVSANPTQKNIVDALHRIGKRYIETIIAVGGGSAIDIAKGIAAFQDASKNETRTLDEITESIKGGAYKGRKYPEIIAVPSTSGTGSEVTQWATVWDERKACKFSIDAPGLKPVLALIVPELTASMPPSMTLSTGLDTMCQAIEAYWSRHTTPLVQEIAYRAIQLVIAFLQKGLDEPRDLETRENLCRASVLAGLAFSQTRTTACHSISYPLTLMFGIPHGLAASITLDPVGQINRGHFPNDDELFALFEPFGGIAGYIDSACEGILRMRLAAFGVTASDIPKIVENAFTAGRMNNNPVVLSKDDIFDILLDVLI